jgi:hypothetical protein
MTHAVVDRAHTALNLLFDSDEETPQALARRTLSEFADGSLAHAVENLPKAIRQSAVREIANKAADLLDIDLVGLLVTGWRKQHDLTAAARRTMAAPGSVELVDLAAHQITTTQRPAVAIFVNGHRVATLQLGLSVVFDVSALVAGISTGRLVALHSGRCNITATLAIQGTNVVTRHAELELPGVIPLRPGIPLVTVHSQPSGTGQAEGPADDEGGDHAEGSAADNPAPSGLRQAPGRQHPPHEPSRQPTSATAAGAPGITWTPAGGDDVWAS